MIEDLRGKRFNKLIVLDKAERGRDGSAFWICQCDCGKITRVKDYKLKKGQIKSCGCLLYGKNTYEFSQDIGIGYTKTNKVFIFDKEDFDKIKDYYWGIDYAGYASAKGNSLKMHRLLMNCPDDMVVDHINRNKADNRKANLRICNQQDNIKNQSLRKNNASGCTGVRLYNYKGKERYIAQISVNGKKKHIGYFDTFEEAQKARCKAEELYYKEFAPIRK